MKNIFGDLNLFQESICDKIVIFVAAKVERKQVVIEDLNLSPVCAVVIDSLPNGFKTLNFEVLLLCVVF
jgi:hypothetical protein